MLQQFSPSAGRPHDDLEEYMDIGTALGRSQRQNKPKKQAFVTKKLNSRYIKFEHDTIRRNNFHFYIEPMANMIFWKLSTKKSKRLQSENL